MKIGILTLYYQNYNFGGMLQAYALCQYLNQKGYDAEQISIKYTSRDYFISQIKKSTPKTRLKLILYFIERIAVEIMKKLAHPTVVNNLSRRKKVFNEFSNKIPHSSTLYTKNTIVNANDVYDLFICGSDVIWNCEIPAEISALGFTSKPKIAYAPSVGSSYFPEWWIGDYKYYVDKIDFLSMREMGASCQLEKVLGKQVKCVVDPTLLLTAEDWSESLSKRIENTKECFCYILGNDRKQREQIVDFSRKNNLKLVTEPYATNQLFRRCDINFGDIQDYSSGPMEFIEHIRNSEIIVTDSFHASVFSIIFNKEFYAVPRINGRDPSLSGRIKTLLKTLGLEARYIEDLSQLERKPIEYANVNNIVSKLREESLTYLEDSIKETC